MISAFFVLARKGYTSDFTSINKEVTAAFDREYFNKTATDTTNEYAHTCVADTDDDLLAKVRCECIDHGIVTTTRWGIT